MITGSMIRPQTLKREMAEKSAAPPDEQINPSRIYRAVAMNIDIMDRLLP
jgi:hypothetical protein